MNDDQNVCFYCEEPTDTLIPTLIPLFSGLEWMCCQDCSDFAESEKIRLLTDPENLNPTFKF